MSILQKRWQIYFLFGKSLKKGCNYLYFHSFTFNMSYKLFSFLMVLHCCVHINSPTPTFGNINLTEKVIDLIVDHLLLFLSNWHCRKLGMTNLPGHDGKVTLDKKMIFIIHKRNKGGNRDYCFHFSVTFKTTGKFLIVFVRLILGKKEVDGVTRPRREIDIKYEFNF